MNFARSQSPFTRLFSFILCPCLYISVSLSLCLSLCPSSLNVPLSLFSTVSFSLCVSLSLSLPLFLFLFICLSAFLSPSLCLFLLLSPFLSPSVFVLSPSLSLSHFHYQFLVSVLLRPCLSLSLCISPSCCGVTSEPAGITLSDSSECV